MNYGIDYQPITIVNNNVNTNTNVNDSYVYDWFMIQYSLIIMALIGLGIWAFVQPQSFFAFVVIIAFLVGSFYALRGFGRSLKRRHARVRALRRDAEIQNAAYLRGDRNGMYGRYTPYTIDADSE